MHRVLIAITLFPTIVLAESPCLSSFNEFLSTFEKSPKFQLENISYPLKYSFIDATANPEPKTINTLKSKSDLVARNKPVYPSISAQQKTSLVKKVHSQSQVNKIIHLHKPNTDYKIKYHFKKVGSCWKLVMLESLSL